VNLKFTGFNLSKIIILKSYFLGGLEALNRSKTLPQLEKQKQKFKITRMEARNPKKQEIYK
jgi:hypothetical protein